MLDLRRDGDVFVLTMDAGENRFNRSFLTLLNDALDEVERSDGPAALVTTGGSDKFYSNGLDLDWLAGQDDAEAHGFIADVIRLFGRVLGMAVPSVAAINGHAFAGGAMLALAHDFRVMRADRGFFCLPEIDLGMPLAAGMSELLRARLWGNTLRDLVLTGMRVGGNAAAERGIVDHAEPADQVLPRAIALAAGLAAKNRKAYGALKRNLWGDSIDILRRGML